MEPNTRLRIEISNPSTLDSRDDGFVNLRIEDDLSGTPLVDVRIPSGRWHRLQLGTSQTHPGFVSPHLDRVGKRLLTKVVDLGRDWDRDDPPNARDVYGAVHRGLSEEWHGYQDHDIRQTNKGWEAVIRKWVAP